MFLKTLNLTNFRNYSKLLLEFDQVTLLLGDNAQGKSNILEAIYFLATTKSIRVEKEVQLIKQGETFLLAVAEIDETKLEIGLQVVEGSFTKKVKVNGVPRRVVDYIGNLVVIAFVPEDINLVTGSPSLRRWHIDVTLAQTDREYKRVITEYGEVITARNKVLKRVREGEGSIDEIDFWTQKALELGMIIQQKRTAFFDFINQEAEKIGEFAYTYQPSIISQERLADYQSREIASANSLIGPHRDDFTFIFKGQQLSVFGSRGEQRTAVLDLKLLELQFMIQLLNITPILLLDDVFSELDDEHRAHVIEITKGQQTIISAVANESIPDDFLQKVQIIRIEDGKVV